MTSEEPKRGRGRPPLAEGETTVRVPVRMPASDHALVERAAKIAGVSIAELAREATVARAKRIIRGAE